MRLEPTPEPTPEERAALEQALAELLTLDGRADGGAWWREGLREAMGEDPREITDSAT